MGAGSSNNCFLGVETISAGAFPSSETGNHHRSPKKYALWFSSGSVYLFGWDGGQYLVEQEKLTAFDGGGWR